MPNTHPYQLGTYHMVNDSSFEPQRNNNFELQITGLGGSSSMNITLSVASYAAPQINVSQIDIPYGNNVVKYAGKPEFPNSSVVLNDYIGINVERILTSWQKLVYDPETQKVGLARDYKKTAYLIEYAPDGSSPRQWQLDGCWPSELQLGDYNQEGNAVRQISMTLTYDRAIPIN